MNVEANSELIKSEKELLNSGQLNEQDIAKIVANPNLFHLVMMSIRSIELRIAKETTTHPKHSYNFFEREGL